jgi:hypothetical protein
MIAIAQSHALILTGRIMAGLAVGLSAAPGQVRQLPPQPACFFKCKYLLNTELYGVIQKSL